MTERETELWQLFIAATSQKDKADTYQKYHDEVRKRNTPYSLTFEFESVELRDQFEGYMSDGGGEYMFIEASGSALIQFFYQLRNREADDLDRVVKVVR